MLRAAMLGVAATVVGVDVTVMDVAGVTEVAVIAEDAIVAGVTVGAMGARLRVRRAVRLLRLMGRLMRIFRMRRLCRFFCRVSRCRSIVADLSRRM